MVSPSERVWYLPVLGPWRDGYDLDPVVIIHVEDVGSMPCTPGTARAMFFMLTGQFPEGQRV